MLHDSFYVKLQKMKMTLYCQEIQISGCLGQHRDKWKGEITKGHSHKTFGGDGYVCYLDYGDSFMSVYIC